MKFLSSLLILMCASHSLFSQKFVTDKSTVSFYSDAPLEAIKAENTKAISIINLSNGQIVFSIPIQDFEFEKDLMKQHFNEKYLETEKYPKATFSGQVEGIKSNTNEAHEVIAKGKMTLHGVTKEIEVKGTLTMLNNKPNIKAAFKIRVADYEIAIPQLLWKNIAEEVEVKLDFNYKP